MQTINTPQKESLQLPQTIKTQFVISWILSFGFLLATTIYYFISQPELPLFYTLADKEEQLAPKLFLFILPVVSFAISTLHFGIVQLLKRFSVLILKLFVGTTITLQLIIGYALLRIIIITI